MLRTALHSRLVCRYALLAVSVLGPTSARADPIDPFALPAEAMVLPNGLTVLLAPDPRARLATVMVSYAAGAADDPDGLRGLAHMVEHLLARRTKHVTDASRELERSGGCLFNATTTLDSTAYFESVPPERLATALWLESDRMGYGADAVREEDIKVERAVLANEDRDRNRDSELAAVRWLAMHELFPEWHPYAPGADDANDIDGIRAKDVLAFLATWYMPSNATLAIAGAFDRDSTVALVRRYFGSLRSGRPPERPRLPEWRVPGVKLVVNAGTSQDGVLFAWRTPVYGSRDDAALDLMASALAGPGNERLTRVLIAPHLARYVRARQESHRRASFFTIEVTAEPGADLERIIAETQSTVDDLGRAANEAETARARDIWRVGSLTSLDAPWGRASRLVEWNAIGQLAGPRFDWGIERRASLSQSDLGRAAAKWLTPQGRVVTVILANRRAPLRGVLVERKQVDP
jgi:zinc protease